MQNRINIAVGFAIGYWAGQVKHGWKAFILAMVLMIIDFFIISFFKSLYTWYKQQESKKVIYKD